MPVQRVDGRGRTKRNRLMISVTVCSPPPKTAYEAAYARSEDNDAQISLLTAVLAPVRKLPEDVLTEVFAIRLEEDIAEATYTSLDCLRAPMLLMQVCAYWRKLISGSTRFWCRLKLDTDSPPAALELLKQFMLRAQNRPLSVFLGTVAMERTFHNRTLDMLLSLPQFHENVQRLQIRSGPRVFHGLHSDRTAPLFAALRTLELGTEDSSRNLEFFAQAAGLDRLTIGSSRSRLDPHLKLARFPWTQLNSLSLEFAGATLVHCRLASTGNINRLDLHPDPPIVFTKLQRLEILGTGKYGLQYFTTPHLLHLTTDTGVLASGDILGAFCNGSQFTLESLEICWSGFNNTRAGTVNAAWLLQESPHLNRLRLVDVRADAFDEFAPLLTDVSQPLLRTLSVSTRDVSEGLRPGNVIFRSILGALRARNTEFQSVEVVSAPHLNCKGSSEYAQKTLETLMKQWNL
ncbi:hypothetical protein C8F01DRAFT_1152275 [Mycena amicta]|nr:hypothetical protein C8F01DRAFT_1152275 [Mycena amicta]